MDYHEDLKSESHTSISIKLPSAQHRIHSRDNGSAGSQMSTERKTFDYNASNTMPSPASTSPFHNFNYTAVNHKHQMLQAATSTIERAWIAYRDKQMFRLLKHSVCAAESSLSNEILRKLCPKEAELLKDNKCQQIRVRFRFGGEEFPPLIFFKVYTHTKNGSGIKYLSGRKMIRPATEAAEDSLKLMGNRNFIDLLIQDTIRQQRAAITDEVDVTTLKDYMQYLSNLDETPAYLGGRDNYWRKLSLDDLPRQTLLFDVVDLAYNQHMTPRLREEISLLMSRPVTQEMQVRHIQAISKLRPPTVSHVPVSTPAKYNQSQLLSGRGSRQAKLRASKMRQLYSDGQTAEQLRDQESTDFFEQFAITSQAVDEEETDAMFDTEAKKLYEWTQGLSLHDDFMAVPVSPLSAAH